MSKTHLNELVAQHKEHLSHIEDPERYGEFLAFLLSQCDYAAGFTGAGFSTESGIPDYRSSGSLWDKYMPIQYDDFISSEKTRMESWQRKFELDSIYSAAKPNLCHKAFSNAVRQGKMQTIITQNIDGLHQAAGIPDEKIIELHGNGTYATCLSCNRRYELSDIKAEIEKTGRSPHCSACGGIVKDAIISFGQRMPEDAMERADKVARSCDFFIAAGSSLVVFPAAGFPVLAKQNGAVLVILNREPTAVDSYADLVVHGELGNILGKLAECSFNLCEFS